MSRINNTFDFIGNISIPKSEENFHRVNESDSGWEGHRINFAIKESNTNSVFVELYGGFSQSNNNVVRTLGVGKNGNKLEIPWDDRFNEETIDMVADFKKYVIDFTTEHEVKKEINHLLYQARNIECKDELTDKDINDLKELKTKLREKAPDRYEFIHPYDAALLLANKLGDYKEHKFRITGNVEYNYWKGEYNRKFSFNTIEIVEDDTPSKLKSTFNIFFTKDAIDDKDFEKEKKMYIYGYVQTYNRNTKTDMFVPQQFVINAQKLDLNKSAHTKRLEFYKKLFNAKGKKVYHLQWEVNIYRGAERVEFTEKDLTQTQKEAVELGLAKPEDYAPKGGMLGDNIYENRLRKPNLVKVNKFDFTSGAIESEYDPEDLEIVPVPEQPKQDEKKEEPTTEEKEIDIDSELDDLFG